MDLQQTVLPAGLVYALLNVLAICTDGKNFTTPHALNHTDSSIAINTNRRVLENNGTTSPPLSLATTLALSDQNRNARRVTTNQLPVADGFPPTRAPSMAPNERELKRSKLNGTLIEAESKTVGSINSINTGATTPQSGLLMQNASKSQNSTTRDPLHFKHHNGSYTNAQVESDLNPLSDDSLHNDTAVGSISDCKNNCSSTASHTTKKNRHRKHMHNHRGYKKKFYNYKMLYNSIKHQGEDRRKETEFYAWIFGATMLTLGSLTTMTSCFIFCYCGDKWRQRRRYRYNKDCSYQRVDSVSSVVDSLDHVTII